MENRKALWDENGGVTNPPLRRPNQSHLLANSTNQTVPSSLQTINLSHSFNSNSSEDDILSRSNLSVNAKEWYPPSYSKAASLDSGGSSNTKSVQSRLQKFKNPPQEDNESRMGQLSLDVSNETSNDIIKMEGIIQTLTTDPGQYDNLLGTFIETLGPYYEDINVVINTTNLIFNHALKEPNFRYTAARLCSAIEEQCQLFRSHLYIICKKRIDDNKCDSNLALFLAELYSQLQFENLYGQCVISALQRILSPADPNNVKAVCQSIKLTGASLDNYHKAELNKIFDQLNRIKQDLPSSIVNLINSVVNLRASNWGQDQNNSTTTNNGYENVFNEPIFYGPDGQELTDEEKQFLSENCSYQAEFLTDDSDPDALWDPDPEMDEEMQAAFRQFVQLSK